MNSKNLVTILLILLCICLVGLLTINFEKRVEVFQEVEIESYQTNSYLVNTHIWIYSWYYHLETTEYWNVVTDIPVNKVDSVKLAELVKADLVVFKIKKIFSKK